MATTQRSAGNRHLSTCTDQDKFDGGRRSWQERQQSHLAGPCRGRTRRSTSCGAEHWSISRWPPGERYKDNRGEWQERTEWHNLGGYQRIGEILRDYVQKGSRIFVEGELRTRCWDDRSRGRGSFVRKWLCARSAYCPTGLLEFCERSGAPRQWERFVPQEFNASARSRLRGCLLTEVRHENRWIWFVLTCAQDQSFV